MRVVSRTDGHHVQVFDGLSWRSLIIYPLDRLEDAKRAAIAELVDTEDMDPPKAGDL